MNRKMTDYIAVITEEQRRELLRYLEDRRGSYNAKVVVCGVALLVNFLGNKLFVFTGRKEPEVPEKTEE